MPLALNKTATIIQKYDLIANNTSHPGSACPLRQTLSSLYFAGSENLESTAIKQLRTLIQEPDSLYPDAHLSAKKLCFELMLEFSNPQNLADVIQTLFQPNHCDQLVAIFPESFPEELDYQHKMLFFRRSIPLIERVRGISQLSQLPATLENLSNCVFSNDGTLVFNLATVEHLNLRAQRQLHRNLYITHPDFAEKIYSHDATWKLLNEEIPHIKEGITPREAVQHLINELKRDHEYRNISEKNRRYVNPKTWDLDYRRPIEEAGDIAYNALVHFHVYYNTLQENPLSNLIEAFNEIYDLDNFPCFAQITSAATSFLKMNSNNPKLDIRTPLSPEYLTLLNRTQPHEPEEPTPRFKC